MHSKTIQVTLKICFELYVYVGFMLLYTAVVIDRKSRPAFLELELQVDVNHPMWVVRIKLGSSERTADTLSC